MKRSIFLTGIILLVAILTLSSCDFLLNAIYPEFDPDNPDIQFGKNSVKISVNISTDIDVNANPLKIALVPLVQKVDPTSGEEIPGQYELKIDEAWIQTYWSLNTVDYTFTDLPNKAYRVFTWIETEADDNKPGTSEPSAIVLVSDRGPGAANDIFDFRQVTQPLSLEASAFLDSYSRLDYIWIEQWNPNTTVVDNNFSIMGPYTIDRSDPPYNYINLSPNDPVNTISTAYVRILDDMYYPVNYNSNSNFQQVYSTPGEFSFGIDFRNLSPALSDSTWDDNYNLIIQVIVNYTNGTTYQNELWVGLYNSSSSTGTYYDLYINPSFSTAAPYGYMYVYVTDHTDGTTIASNSVYLDGDGYYPFAFYSIYDPTNRDQDIQIYVYDMYWNYVGFYSHTLAGATSGTITRYVDNSGTFSDTAPSGYYNLSVYTSFSSTAPWGYAYVYVVDMASGGTIVSNSAYLDQYGYYPFNFYGIFDPAGSDQQILVYLYDYNWNYIGFYTQNLTGNLTSSHAFTVYDGGSFSGS